MEHKTKQQKSTCIMSNPDFSTSIKSQFKQNVYKGPKQPPTKLCEYCKLRNIYSVLNWLHTLVKFIKKKKQKKRNRSRSGLRKNPSMECVCHSSYHRKPNQLYHFLYKIYLTVLTQCA